MRYLFSIILLSLFGNAFAGIKQQWESMPDSILDKSRATITVQTDAYLSATLSGSYEVQMRQLQAGDNTVVCMVRTYSAPEKESVVEIYDAAWVKLRTICFTLADVVGDADAERVSRYFEPLLISAQLSQDSDDLVISVSDKFLSDDDKKDVEGLELQRTVKWQVGKYK